MSEEKKQTVTARNSDSGGLFMFNGFNFHGVVFSDFAQDGLDLKRNIKSWWDSYEMD